MQMSHGYPSENIIWVRDKSGSEDGIKNGLFILSGKANVFAKFKVECLNCQKINKFTSCKTVFEVPSGFCKCNKKGQKISVLALSPYNSQIWSDCLRQSFKEGDCFEMR